MLPKTIQYKDPFLDTGEPRVRLLERNRDRAGFCKHACREVNEYLATVNSQPGKRYVLVLAMSAGEHYGPNRNGDAFAEEPVKINGEWAVAPGETLVDHFKTFESHAHCFRHHINKDPDKKLGDVVKAFYNHEMHRVELLLEVDEQRGNDVVNKLDNGEFPGVSMGCRIKYDVCSICGHQAATVDDYCEHVSGDHPDYGMNQLLEDGRRCFVWNPSPTLFDISFVFKPADRIGYTMKKVAYSNPYTSELSAKIGEKVAYLNDKQAALQKLSDIDKIIQGEALDPEKANLGKSELKQTQSLIKNIAPKIIANMPEVSQVDLEDLTSKSLPSIISSFNACGMCPTAPEIYYIVSSKQGLVPQRDIANKIVRTQGILADIISVIPQIINSLEMNGVVGLDQRLVDPEIVKTILPYREKRALWKEHLAKNYMGENTGNLVGEATGQFDPSRAYYTPNWEPLTFTDGNTGRKYQTTLDAARRADWDNTKKSLIEGTGVAGLSALATKSFGGNNKWKWLAPPVLGATAFAGREVMRNQSVPEVKTDQGIGVPANTEFKEKTSSAALQYGVPLAGGTLSTFLMSQDYNNNPEDSSELSRFSAENPVVSTIGATAALSGGVHGVNRLRSRLKSAMIKTADIKDHAPHEASNISLENVVNFVGNFVLSQ